jgi:hypothetical protein
VNPSFDELLPRHFTKNIIPHLAHKMGFASKFGCGYGLIGPFAAGV